MSDLEARLRGTVDGRVPGVAVAVVDADGVRESAAVGMADLAEGRPASPDMVCPWFSMTKIATATAAMQLAEGGELDMDAPVAPLVPEMRHLRPASDAGRITTRHLLSHSAGIANPIPVSWIHRPSEPAPDPAAFLDGLLSKHGKLRFAPGATSRYSNLGVLIAGAAMARAAEEPFADVIGHRVLEPLGMASTGFTYSPDMQARAATGHHPRWSPLRYLLKRWVIGHPAGRWIALNPFLLDGQAYGGLLGPVTDAARFARMHLRDGELDGVRVLEPSSVREMRDIRFRGRHIDVGLGWFRPSSARDAAVPFVQHLGGGAGFYNVLRIYPTRGIGIVVMGNATKYDIDAVVAAALADP